MRNPYNKKEVSPKEFKDQLFKRITKHIKGLKINVIDFETDLDEYAKEIVNNHFKVIKKIEKTGSILPFCARHKAYLFLYELMFSKKIENPHVFMFEKISDIELELIGIKEYKKTIDKKFAEIYDLDKKEFELVKNFLDNIEKKYPGTDLACEKSAEFIQSLLNKA